MRQVAGRRIDPGQQPAAQRQQQARAAPGGGWHAHHLHCGCLPARDGMEDEPRRGDQAADEAAPRRVVATHQQIERDKGRHP